MYYVINAIFNIYKDEGALRDYYDRLAEDPKAESLKTARNPRELVLESYFLPFMCQAIKELKCEFIQFLVNPDLDALIAPWRLPRGSNDGLDFTKLT